MRSLNFKKDKLVIYQLIAGLAVVTLIILGCILVLKPFFPAGLMAIILTLATWPGFMWLREKLHDNTARAALLMTILLAMCFIAPVFLIGTSIADNYDRIYTVVQKSLDGDPAIVKERLRGVPIAGETLAEVWESASSDRKALSKYLSQYSGRATQTLLALGKNIGTGLFDVTLGVIIAFFLFRHGTEAAMRIGGLIDTFGGEHGHRLLVVCKDTLIGVVYGLLGTALAQGALGVIGFWIAGVPGAPFLGFLIFMLSLVPVGPPLVWIPAAFWLFSEGATGWAAFLVVWGIFVIGMIDNIMKPYFISKGSNLPLLLVLLGIMGGVIAFGFIGLFIGPTLLALAYSMVLEWSTVRKVAETVLPPEQKKKSSKS